MEKQQSIAVVTGSATGIGFETSLLLARNGFYTYATMRDTQKSNKIEKIARDENLPLKVLSLDVNNDDSVRSVIQKILDEKEKVDILVNNAGYGLFGALEDISLDEIKRQFDTNLFGAIRTIKEVLPTMRKQKNGIIINVTSIAGVVGVPAECIYVSSKFALEGLSESISYELQPYGIKVILIEPGVINTNFVPNIKFPNPRDEKDNIHQTTLQEKEEKKSKVNYSNNDIYQKHSSYYSNTINAFLSHYYPAMKNALLPNEVATVILEAIKNASGSSDYFFRYTIGEDAKTLAYVKKNVSDSELHKFISNWLLK
jgi:NAD(P)-dependent dehydrogenase (short-subunit alcohol dehydrogenase family)